MNDDKVIAQKDGPVGSMIFNNPGRRNAVSLGMWERAAAILNDFAGDPAIRVVVLSGAGGKAFASGADISEFERERATADAVARYNATTERTSSALYNLPKPTIAMIEGWCIGGGLALAIACDLRIASETSRFGIPAARLGVGYGVNGIRRLVDLVGPAAAKDIFFTARHYTAAEALRLGLVNAVVPAAALESHVRDYAAMIAANAPLTIAAVKRTVGEVLKDPADRDTLLCERLIAACHASQDYIEGRRAFMEKRQPNFAGR